MATTIQRRQRQASPERWQTAFQRAIAGNVRVLQIDLTGQWVATSASNPTTGYELEVTNGVPHGCSCLAGINGDPICVHRAAWYVAHGLIEIGPEPTPPAAPVAPLVFTGQGRTVIVSERAADGKWEILDPAKRQRLGAAGELDFILSRLANGGFVREEGMALAA